MSLPQGYSKTGDYNYRATKTIPVKRKLRRGSGFNKSKNLSYDINNQTGAIQVSLDGQPFWEYNAEKNKWTVPSGQVDNYIEATKFFGDPSSDTWKVIERNGKQDATSIISDPDATSFKDRATISQTNGYRSSIDNSRIESEGAGPNNLGEEEQPETTSTAQTSISAELKQSSIQVKRAAAEPPSDSLRYPEKIPTGMDTIRFSKFEYTVRRASGFTFADRQRIDQKQALASVTLGIQDGIKDSNTVGWTGKDLSPIKTAGLDLLYGAATGGKDGAGNSFDRLAKDLENEGANLKAGILSKIAEFALGTNNLTARTTGGIFNPNRELLFDSPNLRKFDFQFYLSPRTPTEATNVKNIIRFFKQGMAPRRSTGELFLKSPHTFGITYLHNNTQNPSLNRIKECALVGCDVDYTPTGSYITFEDGTPVQYVIKMSFQELVPVYEDDYSENEIGY